MDPRKSNTSRKEDRRARLTRERRVCTKRNVPSPEAPRHSPERGNTRRSIVEDRAAACELPPSRRVSEYVETSVVRLSVGRSKSAWSANLTLRARLQRGGQEWRPRQAEETRDEQNETRRETIRLICTNHCLPPPCCHIRFSLKNRILEYTRSSDRNKELYELWQGLSFLSCV